MSLFGTTAAPAAGSLFGSTATSSAGTQPATGGLFGSTAIAAGSLFGATAAPASGTVFGAPVSTATSAPGTLFGATTASTAAPATGGLFGTAATPAPLFGAKSTPTSTTASTGGLFGAKTATTATGLTAGGSLFGATTAATTTPATGGLFGAATTTAPSTSTSLGLGGLQQQKTIGGGTSATGGSSTLPGGDKEATKDGGVAAAAEIRNILPLIEEKLRKNRELMEEVDNMACEHPATLDELVDKTRGWMNEVLRKVRDAHDTTTYVANLVTSDKAVLETTRRLQEAATTNNQTALSNTIKRHLFEMTDSYEGQMVHMQERVDSIRRKFERLLIGEPMLSMEELDDMFKKCDRSYAAAQHHIHDTGREIEALKNQLIEQGYTHLRKSYPVQQPANTEGAEFFPSQSSLAVIGSSLRTPAASAPVLGSGLGGFGSTLGTTGTGLFGSNTGGMSLFGSTNQPKPTFSGGSLFGNLTGTTSSAAPTTTTTTTSSSLFPSFGSAIKPTTTFASTVSNNSSGLLFSMKK